MLFSFALNIFTLKSYLYESFIKILKFVNRLSNFFISYIPLIDYLCWSNMGEYVEIAQLPGIIKRKDPDFPDFVGIPIYLMN